MKENFEKEKQNKAPLNIPSKVANDNYNYLSARSLDDILNDPTVKVNYIVEDLFPEKAIILISGDTGVGKSLFTQILAASLSNGAPLLNEFQSKEVNIAFLDRENDASILKSRYEQLSLNPEKIFYIDINSSLTKAVIDELKLFLKDNNIGVLIVDTLVRFQEGDENNSKDVSKFYEALRVLLHEVRTIFVLHHLRKNNGEKQADVHSNRGSGDIVAGVDQAFIIERINDSSKLRLRNVKNRFGSKQIQAVFEFHSPDQSISTTYLGESIPSKSNKTELTTRLVIEYLNERAEANFDEINEYVSGSGGYSQSQMRKVLKSMIESNLIYQTKRSNTHFYSVNTTNLKIKDILKQKSPQFLNT